MLKVAFLFSGLLCFVILSLLKIISPIAIISFFISNFVSSSSSISFSLYLSSSPIEYFFNFLLLFISDFIFSSLFSFSSFRDLKSDIDLPLLISSMYFSFTLSMSGSKSLIYGSVIFYP